jgi:hypothetical protein
MQTQAQDTGPIVLRGLQALEYASRHPGTPLRRQGLFGTRSETLSLESAYRLAQIGADGQVFVAVEAGSP